MSDIIFKEHKVYGNNTFISYGVNNLDYRDSILSICNDLINKGVIVKGIGVTKYINDPVRDTTTVVYDTVDKYLSEYGITFTDSFIQSVAISCSYNGLNFSLNFDKDRSVVFATIFDYKDEVNLDEIIRRTSISRN